MKTQKIPFRPRKKSSKKKITFAPRNETFHYSYKNQAESVEDTKAVFPNFEDRIIFNVNFAYFDLDVSLRECSITSPLNSYQELCPRFKDPTSSIEEEKQPFKYCTYNYKISKRHFQPDIPNVH